MDQEKAAALRALSDSADALLHARAAVRRASNAYRGETGRERGSLEEALKVLTEQINQLENEYKVVDRFGA